MRLHIESTYVRWKRLRTLAEEQPSFDLGRIQWEGQVKPVHTIVCAYTSSCNPNRLCALGV